MNSGMRRVVGVAGVLAVWQLVAASGWIPAAYFPGVPEVFDAARELVVDREFWRNEGYTLARAVTGFALGASIALLLALAAARSITVERALSPLVELFRSMPPAPLVPLAIFALGLGAPLYLFIITFACIWPVYVGASRALSTPEPVQVQAARSIGLSDGRILRSIRLPAALPEIFSGLRLSIGISLLAAVAAEMLAGQNGLGAMLFQSAFALRTAETFALLFVAGLDGLMFQWLLELARRPTVGWHDRLAATAQE